MLQPKFSGVARGGGVVHKETIAGNKPLCGLEGNTLEEEVLRDGPLQEWINT